MVDEIVIVRFGQIILRRDVEKLPNGELVNHMGTS